MQVNQPQPKRCYSIKEAAKIIGVCRGSIYNEITAGRLLPIKVGTRTLITLEEINRYIAEQEDAARMRRTANHGSLMTLCVGGYRVLAPSARRSGAVSTAYRDFKTSWRVAVARLRHFPTHPAGAGG